MSRARISNLSNPLQSQISVEICKSIKSRFLGLMFRRNLSSSDGILLIEPSESRINSAIHMFFMNFDIAVVWINSNRNVVDVIYARRWTPAYLPSQPAKYTMEIHPSRLDEFHIGDQISIDNA